MSTIEITKENFQSTYESNDIVILDFWAEWCGPCKSFAPVYESVSKKFPNVIFGKIDTEKQPELAAHFEIRSIPTIMVIREQIELFFQPGALNEELLIELVEKVTSLDMEEVKKQLAVEEAEDAEE
ncbi:MAG: thioredoxin [Bdellovibrionaceae bacterium]|nr:thioredoxin [Pseudobdellovibrionaceae bacterium]